MMREFVPCNTLEWDFIQGSMSTSHPLETLLRQRIAIIDGAMGTTIRTYGLTEADIRGERFAGSKKDLLNNGDLFSITQPKMICDIHRRFLEAGADIIETNTFSATNIGQSEFFVDDPREHGGRKDPEFYQRINLPLSAALWGIWNSVRYFRRLRSFLSIVFERKASNEKAFVTVRALAAAAAIQFSDETASAVVTSDALDHLAAYERYAEETIRNLSSLAADRG